MLSVIAVFAISAGILLAAQSGCIGASLAGTDGSYDTSDIEMFEHVPVQEVTAWERMTNLSAACQIADTFADMFFTGVLDAAYAVHAVLSLTPVDNITDDNSSLRLNGARGITTFVSGGHTYAAVTSLDDSGVQILNITNPSNITATDSIVNDGSLELWGAYDITTFVSGGHTYAAVAALRDNGVQILNVTDPSNITAAGHITDTPSLELEGAADITTFVSDGHTYAAVAATNDNGVQILDVTNPPNIIAAGNITDDGTSTDGLELEGARGITIFESGGHKYAAVAAYTDSGVQILNVTDPSNITAAGSITDDNISLELAGATSITTFKSGGHTYVAVAAYLDDGVQILDVTNPPNIIAAGSIQDTPSLKLNGAQGITTFESGGHTYAAVASYSNDGVQILDVTTPSSITAVGNIAGNGTNTDSLELWEAFGITTFESGGHTYAAVTASRDDGVQIIRIDIPPDTTLSADAFVTTWTVSAGQNITINFVGDDINIDWGDGATDTGVDGPKTHTYIAANDYTVSVTGGLTGLTLDRPHGFLDLLGPVPELASIDQWGGISWTNMSNAFAGASNMVYNATDAPDLSGVPNMSYMFEGATTFNGNLSSWDVSSVTDMSYMFTSASSFNHDLSAWDVSSVTDMSGMFTAADFNQPLNTWDVSSVTYMNNMFRGASSFNHPLNTWDVSSVTDMQGMFYAADFNHPLNTWDVSSVTDMGSMFSGASSFNGTLSDWNVSSVTDMSYMFSTAAAFNQPLNAWDVSSVIDMFGMFAGATSFDQNLGNWYVVPDSVSIARTAVPGIVGSISAQNTPLNNHNQTYGIGIGGDSARFTIVPDNQLNMISVVDTKLVYTVNVTASGGSVFQDGNNWRVLEIEVTGQIPDTTPPSISEAVAASLNSITVTFSENVNADATDGSHWSLGRTDAGSLTVSANTNPAGISDSMTLTLSGDLPDTRPDLSLIYIKPTTGGITDGTNQLEGATVIVVDGIAPTVLSVEAVTSRSIAVRMSEPVTSDTAGPGGFSLTTGGTAPAVSSISVSGETVTLTLSGPLPAGAVTLNYDSTSGNVADVSDNTLADFSSVAVDTSADITPPSMSGAVAASLNSITVTFSENVNADATDGSHWSLGRTDAGSLTVSANTNPAGISDSMTLTLSGDLPDTRPDLSLIYIKPTTGGITDGTNQLEGATVIVVDGIAPTVTSARTASGTAVTLTLSEDVSDASATPGDFSLSGVASSPTVSSISVSGKTVTLTLSSAIVTSDSPLLSYSRTSGFVQDASFNSLADFSSMTVDTSADITPPSISEAVAASLNSITVTFSENVNADATDGSHWSLGRTDAGSLTVSANTNPAGISDSMTLTLSGDLPDTRPDLSLIYIKPTTGGITDGTNQLEGATVIVVDGIAPTVTGARTASGTVVTLTLSEDVSDASATPGDFSLSGVASSPTVSSISVSGKTVTLTLSSAIVTSDSPLLSYSRSSGFVQDASFNSLADFSSMTVDTSADITPPSISEAVATSLNSITVRFSENVNADATDGSHWSLGRTDASSLTVSANTNPAGISDSMTLTLSGDLPDTRPDLTLIYIKPTTGGITDGTNQLEGATVIVVDGIAPTVTSARTASGTAVTLTLSEDVSDASATPGDFSLSSVASSPTVSSISVSGKTVTLTLSSAIVTSDSPLLSYSRTSGFVQDASSNTLADFSSMTVDTSADITPPSISEAVATSLNSITVRFSENVDADATDGSHWSLGGADAGSLTVSANTNPAGTASVMTLTLSGDLPDTGPDLTLIYIKPTTGGITDGTNQLEGATVIVVDGIAPTVTGARTASGTAVTLTLSEDVSDASATPGDFSLSGVASSPTVSSISVSGKTVTLTLSSAIVTSDSPLLSYSRTSGFVQDASSNTLADFSSVTVDTTADTMPPTITITGSNPVTITVGDTYSDAGAVTCTDDVDASPTLTSSGTVDTSTVGSYTVTYSCTDAANNSATQVSRTVIVQTAVIPDIDRSSKSSRSNNTPNPLTTDNSIIIDGQSYDLGSGTTTTTNPYNITTGQATDLVFTAYSPSDIVRFTVYLNLHGDDIKHSDSDMYIRYDHGVVEIVDPHGFISDASITITEDSEQSRKKIINTLVEFEGNMGLTNMVVYIWNEDRRYTSIRMFNALDITSGTETLPDPEPVESDSGLPADPESVAPGFEDDAVDSEYTSSDTPWPDDYDDAQVLTLIRMWSGFESEMITDTQLLELLGLEGYRGVDLQDWMMTELGVLVARGDVTVGEFVLALQYVLENIHGGRLG